MQWTVLLAVLGHGCEQSYTVSPNLWLAMQKMVHYNIIFHGFIDGTLYIALNYNAHKMHVTIVFEFASLRNFIGWVNTFIC